MKNEDFKKYIVTQHTQAQKDLLEAKRNCDAEGQRNATERIKLLESFAKIAAGPGTALRRVRRDYERRLAKIGRKLTL